MKTVVKSPKKKKTAAVEKITGSPPVGKNTPTDPILPPLPPIYVVSGGKGLAGEAVVQSILIQFPNNKLPVIIVPDILTPDNVEEIVQRAVQAGGMIVHTMVVPEMRRALTEVCLREKVPHFDLVGSLSDYLSGLLGMEPISKPGLYRLANIAYFERIRAIEFTLKLDDGQRPDKIAEADIILTGVSRTGKTPLSVYLAMFGWKVANVPLVPEIDPPEALFQADARRVFGLTTSVDYLITQRESRARDLKLPKNVGYIDDLRVMLEIDTAEMVFARGGFTVIQVTNKPIESSANEILTLITDRFGRDNWKK